MTIPNGYHPANGPASACLACERVTLNSRIEHGTGFCPACVRATDYGNCPRCAAFDAPCDWCEVGAAHVGGAR